MSDIGIAHVRRGFLNNLASGETAGREWGNRERLLAGLIGVTVPSEHDRFALSFPDESTL